MPSRRPGILLDTWSSANDDGPQRRRWPCFPRTQLFFHVVIHDEGGWRMDDGLGWEEQEQVWGRSTKSQRTGMV